MNELSININVAGRVYPLSVSKQDEQAVRAAGKMIHEKLQTYAEQFSLKDNQDALAMFALELATEYQKLKMDETLAGGRLHDEILQLGDLLKDVRI